MVKNKYNVPLKMWRKFKEHKALYNDIMDQMIPNQSLTTHPKTPKIPDGQWTTICHNAAVYAIWALQKQPLKKGDTVEHLNMKTGKTIKLSKAK
jgi:hypothetical protein